LCNCVSLFEFIYSILNFYSNSHWGFDREKQVQKKNYKTTDKKKQPFVIWGLAREQMIWLCEVKNSEVKPLDSWTNQNCWNKIEIDKIRLKCESFDYNLLESAPSKQKKNLLESATTQSTKTKLMKQRNQTFRI